MVVFTPAAAGSSVVAAAPRMGSSPERGPWPHSFDRTASGLEGGARRKTQIEKQPPIVDFFFPRTSNRQPSASAGAAAPAAATPGPKLQGLERAKSSPALALAGSSSGSDQSSWSESAFTPGYRSYGDERFFARLRASLDYAAWEAGKAVEAGVHAAADGVHAVADNAAASWRATVVPGNKGPTGQHSRESGEEAVSRLSERIHSIAEAAPPPPMMATIEEGAAGASGGSADSCSGDSRLAGKVQPIEENGYVGEAGDGAGSGDGGGGDGDAGLLSTLKERSVED